MPRPKALAPWRLFAAVPILAAVLIAAPAVGAQDVDVDGDSDEETGSVSETAIEINADGGTAISDASSGDGNFVDPTGSVTTTAAAAQQVGSILEAQGIPNASPQAVESAIADLGLDGGAIGIKDALLLGEYLAGPLTAEQRVGVETAFATAAAGNGGTASANADGGSITVGDINSGGNEGNTIEIGNVGAPAEEADEEKKPAPAPEEKKAEKEAKVAPVPVAEKEAAPVEEEVIEEKAVVVAPAPEAEKVVEAPAPVAPAPAPAPEPVGAAAPVVALPSTGTGPAAVAGWDIGSAGLFGLLAAALCVVVVSRRRLGAR